MKNNSSEIETEALFRSVLNIQDPELLRELCGMAAIVNTVKGERIVTCGEPQTHICFLLEGVFRGFFSDAAGREVTDCLCCERGAPAMAGFALNDTAHIHIEMLTPGRLLRLPAARLLALMPRYPELLVLYNQMLTQALRQQWELKCMLYQCTAMQRYTWFLQRYPGLNGQVSSKYIASFLGMNPVTLSRLRVRLNGGHKP